jgi:MFS family permease
MPVIKRDLLPYQLVMGISTAAIGGIAALLGALRDEYAFSDTDVGVIVAAGFLAAFVSQSALSPLADRGHARRMVVSGIAIAAAAMASMAFIDSWTAWVIARGALGFGGGLILPGVRRAATVLDPARVGENLGLLVVGEIIGFMIGPVLAAALAEIGGIRTPFIAMAAALVLFLPFAARLPPDRGRRDVPRRHSLDLLRRRRLVGALTLVGGYFVLIGAYEAVIPIMFRDRGASTLTTGIAFTLLAIPIAFVGPRAGRTADQYGPPRVAIAGISVVTLSTYFYGFLPGIVPLVALWTVVGVADGFGFTAVQVAVSRAVPEERQAGALGLMGATEVAAAGLAAIPSAALYDGIGEEWTWIVVATITSLIVVSGGLLIRGTSPVTSVTHPLA